ncbi:MAG: hypothetical protein P8J32_01995 [bacterium]|nr:hypothetical protein [bacterium]
MDFHEFNKQITEHFDQCDVHDIEKRYYLDQKLMKNWGRGRTTLLGNPLKLYDTVYCIMWAFAVRNPKNGMYEHLMVNTSYMTRSEIKQTYDLCMEFEAQIDVWGRYIENSKKPQHNFRYSGGVMINKLKETISDFTWKDDILIKTLMGNSKKFSNIWALLREAQVRGEKRRERIEKKQQN